MDFKEDNQDKLDTTEIKFESVGLENLLRLI